MRYRLIHHVYKEDDSGAITRLYGAFEWVTHYIHRYHKPSVQLLSDGRKTVDPWVNPITDVKDTDWFYGAVEFANRHGLYVGTDTDRFAPDRRRLFCKRFIAAGL